MKKNVMIFVVSLFGVGMNHAMEQPEEREKQKEAVAQQQAPAPQDARRAKRPLEKPNKLEVKRIKTTEEASLEEEWEDRLAFLDALLRSAPDYPLFTKEGFPIHDNRENTDGYQETFAALSDRFADLYDRAPNEDIKDEMVQMALEHEGVFAAEPIMVHMAAQSTHSPKALSILGNFLEIASEKQKLQTLQWIGIFYTEQANSMIRLLHEAGMSDQFLQAQLESDHLGFLVKAAIQEIDSPESALKKEGELGSEDDPFLIAALERSFLGMRVDDRSSNDADDDTDDEDDELVFVEKAKEK